ncbi:conserved protein of unknown function [Candidatus Filomicrobium marinum]|uniref:Uncharacterized protein n=2 Tax=Filomicrobium TaxID=119044 RepID=A0A0D6JDW4_9HYPH|nr:MULTISPECIES: DUF6505 family protein [Filomicrobium]MCV0367955.1 DUF6505 family protein [Filomicrobium sp.]CFX17335.1 conserved protein of unknown function [Candidatus Filomicrobium marinum]CPR18231.1 conserved protein of unknown function [Candidatus Filomicrobium marinum]SDO22042.1 hypothetical protein SAMN04488061_0604 [Filomicrobium insigne]
MSGHKLLRTINFDMSDAHVFEKAAEPDEWAISGAFEFADLDKSAIAGKLRQAFANGFLGLTSFGRSTFAVVAQAQSSDYDEAEYRLAQHFVTRYGAPDIEAALPAARGELFFITDLVQDAPINTVFTVRRVLDADGAIKEEFRTIRPPTDKPLHARVWKVEPDET